MSFGKALEALKEGKKVTRRGWNGKGMWVISVEESEVSYRGIGRVKLNQFFVIKNVNNSFSAWVPSINDCNADDWLIVE